MSGIVRNLHLGKAALLAAGLVLLSACSSSPHRPPPGEQEAFIVIAVPNVASVSSEKQSYDCEGLPVNVEYVNAGGVSLANLSFKEDFVVASNVLAASGARYAGSHYVWWSKGDEATFENLMQDPQTAPLQCQLLTSD